jgi:hypothetical protein
MARNVILAKESFNVSELATTVSVPIGASYTEQESKLNLENSGSGASVNGADQITSRITISGTMPVDSEIVVTPYVKNVGALPSVTFLLATITDDTIELVMSKIEGLKDADYVKVTYRFKQTGTGYDVTAISTQLTTSSDSAGFFKLHAKITNGVDGTYDYYVSMVDALRLGIAFVLNGGSGTVTIKVYGTLTNDGTPLASISDWVDITTDMYGVASFTASDLLNDDSNAFALFAGVKIEVVAATGGADDADWTLRTSRR